MIDGVANGIFGNLDREVFAFYILIVCAFPVILGAICPYSPRLNDGLKRNKEYVQAARVIGIPSVIIMARHILPNVMGPVLVIATINLALAIVTESNPVVPGCRYAADPAVLLVR